MPLPWDLQWTFRKFTAGVNVQGHRSEVQGGPLILLILKLDTFLITFL